jgi:cellulose synthase/poly-beta-1,6-N-acetylglucosamine synthase-like glycosyltransferase
VVTFLYITGLIIFLYLFCSITYLLVVAIAGLMYREEPIPESADHARILILIPSFRDDHIITHTVEEALQHNYPREKFDVLVVADSLLPSTVQMIKNLGAQVLEVNTRMKSRSIHAALQSIEPGKYQLVMLLDADNIMKANCLLQVNNAFRAGHLAIQCHRTAKNEQTSVALLDAISEEINNHLFRLGQQSLGFSAAPSGSGMAVEFKLLKAIFNWKPILENPGEDREIDMQLLKRGIQMYYLPEAWVLDEKVATHDVFEKQRLRWLEAQWHHLRMFFEPAMVGVRKDRHYYNKLVQNLLLPRSLYLLVFSAIIILVIIRYATGWAFFFPEPGWWLSLLLFFLLTLAIAMPSRYYSSPTIKALLSLPALIGAMIRALLKVKKGRKEFIPTPKSFTGLKESQK